jgi:hypothetical protein
MNIVSDNVVPGNHGKVFGTNAENILDLEIIKDEVLKIDGVKDVILNTEVFPREFTIHTTDFVKVKDVEDAAISAGFHAIPKGLFEL